jgi:hypothetical protein
MERATAVPSSQGSSERESLLERIAELEAENAELAARAAATIAAAQEQTYWLQRWQVDITSLAAKPWGARMLRLLRRIAPLR